MGWLKGVLRPRPILLFYAGFLPIIATFHANVADLAKVNGASMYPFLNDNKDQSLGKHWFLNWKRGAAENLERGMVVTFRLVSCVALQLTCVGLRSLRTRPLTPTQKSI